jgi:hypothetical protein
MNHLKEIIIIDSILIKYFYWNNNIFLIVNLSRSKLNFIKLIKSLKIKVNQVYYINILFNLIKKSNTSFTSNLRID